MHPSVVAYLREFYRPSVHDLYRLLGRDMGWEGFGCTAGSALPGIGSSGGDSSGGKARFPLGVHQRWGTMPQLSSGGGDGQQEGGEESSEPSKKGSGQPSEEAGRPRVFQLHARHDSAHDSAHSGQPPIPSAAAALSGQPPIPAAPTAVGVAASAHSGPSLPAAALAAEAAGMAAPPPVAPSDTSDGGENISGELLLADGSEPAPNGALVLEVLP